MYQPAIVREEAICSRAGIAVVMGWLIFTSFFTALDTATTAGKFADTGMPDRLTTHAFISLFKFLLLSYSIYGFIAAIDGSQHGIGLLYNFTTFVSLVAFFLIISAAVPCTGTKTACDVRGYFERIATKTDEEHFIRWEHELWLNVQKNFRCCGLNSTQAFLESNELFVDKPCRWANEEWHMTMLVGPIADCVSKANFRDLTSRYSLILDGIALLIIIGLLLDRYFYRAAPAVSSAYRQSAGGAMFMGGDPRMFQQQQSASQVQQQPVQQLPPPQAQKPQAASEAPVAKPTPSKARE